MKKLSYLGALDIGSENITFLVGEIVNGVFRLLAHTQTPSQGIRKATVNDMKAALNALKLCFESMQKKVPNLPQHICLSQSGPHIRSMQYSVQMPLKSLEHVIDDNDVQQLHQLALQKTIPEQNLFLHHFRQYYTIDNANLENPCGHSGRQLLAQYYGLFAQSQAVKQNIYLANQFGFQVQELVFSGLAAALATTTSIERENGVCVINIGAGVTDYVVFKHQYPVSMGSFPVGGNNFTYDLCSGLRIHFDDAERIKKDYGISSIDDTNVPEDLWIVGNKTIGDKKIKTKHLRIIQEARAKELMDALCRQIRLQIGDESFLSGVILTGGGSLLKNIEKVAANSFQCDCSVRCPLNINETFNKPSYSTAIGLLQYAVRQQRSSENRSPKNLWKRLSAWFS